MMMRILKPLLTLTHRLSYVMEMLHNLSSSLFVVYPQAYFSG